MMKNNKEVEELGKLFEALYGESTIHKAFIDLYKNKPKELLDKAIDTAYSTIAMGLFYEGFQLGWHEGTRRAVEIAAKKIGEKEAK